MPGVRHVSRIEASPEELFRWHARPGALERLLPPWEPVRLLHREEGLRDGARVHLELRWGPWRRRWVAVHRDCEEGRQFADEQAVGPFRRWVHVHRFLPAPGGCFLEDDLAYELPFSPLAESLLGGVVRRRLLRMLRWRHRRTARDLARHAAYGERPALRVAITGASGLVGSELTAFLRSGGHRVDPLVRRRPRPGTTEIRWSPASGFVDAAALEGVDAVVHLAGENLFALGWTPGKKLRIRQSRVAGTRLLAETLAGLRHPPRVLVSASAVGYYGSRGTEWLPEEAGPGNGFLAELCRDWEVAVAPAEAAGIRVVRPRIGIVLTPRGGALRTMLPAFRAGLGAVLGDGEQYVSWIGLDDLVGVIHRSLWDERLRGPLNAVSPAPVTNRELSRTLGRVLGRPVLLRAPTAVLRLALREMAEETFLTSTRARPSALQAREFSFLAPGLEEALRWEMGRPAEPTATGVEGGG
ncbi:MAG: TIGR01777 family oxidoreductase [Gemmatimonadota bacterium]